MYDILAVSNRKLCSIDYFEQIAEIMKSDIKGIILREKDLSENEYFELAEKVMKICSKYNKLCILHTFIDVSRKLNCRNIHLPLDLLIKNSANLDDFRVIGTSIHSAEDAVIAEKCGASYLTAGHIFSTDCKKGVPPRGINFLENVCNSVNIPVYGIGGISPDNVALVNKSGADGICIMSGIMTAKNSQQYVLDLNNALIGEN